jgi:precorrin-6B C5,15-methyltransferase / cobalt-precorrin-6B C5,C15-methyltransferase
MTASAPRRWLAIVGIGEDGAEGLSPAAGALVSDADVVFGGQRHLALAAALIRGEARAWPSPFEEGIAAVVERRGGQVCVLASGDPFHFGVGAVLARHVDPAEMVVVPGPSAFSLAAARLGWALADCTLLSLHARSHDLLRPHLQPGARLLALTSDGEGPAALARLLAENGFGASRLTVLEALGGPRERVRATTAAAFDLGAVDPLNMVAIEVLAAPGARVIARSAGLDDALFEHDGQISKREVRAITLSALAPRRGELLWDVGAGSGSVAIEWMLADPAMRAVAIEADAARAARIARNAAAFGVPRLVVVHGTAPAAFSDVIARESGRSSAPAPGRTGCPACAGHDDRENPDAIFVGGGASGAVLDAAVAALRPGGRLVVNAVTLATQALLIARHAAAGGTLIRVAIERAEPLGGMTAWRPALPVTQWTWIKPEAAP